jgi:two-component system KDP operon response regulator KdpE
LIVMAVGVLIVWLDEEDPEWLVGLDDSSMTLTHVHSLAQAVRSAVASPPRAALVVARHDNALEPCEILHAVGDFPLILASHNLSPGTATKLLDLGVDVAIGLPAPVEEILARIRVVLRRGATQHAGASIATRISAGDLVIDLNAHRVWWRGREVDLAPTEFQLLSILADNAGHVVTNRDLLTRIWGPDYIDDVHYIRLYVGYLRNKIEDDPHRPRVIVNQWGVGYRLEVAELLPTSVTEQIHGSLAPAGEEPSGPWTRLGGPSRKQTRGLPSTAGIHG